jgi:hypothetical protein
MVIFFKLIILKKHNGWTLRGQNERGNWDGIADSNLINFIFPKVTFPYILHVCIVDTVMCVLSDECE